MEDGNMMWKNTEYIEHDIERKRYRKYVIGTLVAVLLLVGIVILYYRSIPMVDLTASAEPTITDTGKVGHSSETFRCSYSNLKPGQEYEIRATVSLFGNTLASYFGCEVYDFTYTPEQEDGMLLLKVPIPNDMRRKHKACSSYYEISYDMGEISEK